jgi:hypothetical protein
VDAQGRTAPSKRRRRRSGVGRAAIEVADIFRAHGTRYREKYALLPHHHKLMRAIERCRTAALGGHVERCGHCAYRRISYNSCRNRHCPKCQNLARGKWLERRRGELLPVEYFHVVFTIPDAFHDLALQNRAILYHLLFQASAGALQSIAADPKHLGADLGFFSILHTWGQNLMLHPHIHAVVTGGGLSLDRKRWISTKPGFLLSVRVLSRRFRTLLVGALRQAFDEDQLRFQGSIEALRDPQHFHRWLDGLSQIEWVVYAKPPFGGPHQVLEYLGRYTHRVAIGNQRLSAFDGERVTFQYKDYRQNGGRERSKRMTLDGLEFVRRFMLHALPPGFQRIRHYGILASSQKRTLLPLARLLLEGAFEPLAPTPGQLAQFESLRAVTQTLRSCPQCRVGAMEVIESLAPWFRTGVPSTLYDTG